MSGNGTEVHYTPPDDPGVWHAPETMAWAVCLLLAMLAVTLAVRPLLYRLLDRAREPETGGKLTLEQRNLLLDPGFRTTLLVLIASILGCGGTMLLNMRLGHPAGYRAVTLNTDAGLPAAALLLTLPSIALFASSVIAVAYSTNRAAAVAGTGLLRVVWSFAGGAGCLFTAAFGAIAGPYPPALLAVVGLSFILLGLVRRSAHLADGTTVLEHVAQVEREVHAQEGKEAAAQAPEQGECWGESPFAHWGRILGIAAAMPAFVLVFTLIALSQGEPNALPGLDVALPVLGMGAFVGLIIFLATARNAKVVHWDREGVEVTWYRGVPRRFAWEELRSLSFASQKGTDYATAYAASGAKWSVNSRRDGYEGLVLALKAHVWAAGEDQQAASERPDYWDSEMDDVPPSDGR